MTEKAFQDYCAGGRDRRGNRRRAGSAGRIGSANPAGARRPTAGSTQTADPHREEVIPAANGLSIVGATLAVALCLSKMMSLARAALWPSQG